MPQLAIRDVSDYVADNINTFHKKKRGSLQSLRLGRILHRKTPNFFLKCRARNIHSVYEIVQMLLDTHISCQEEALFRDFLKNLAIYVNSKAYNGVKSSAEGVDLEFGKPEEPNTRYLVSIKSGPNWGNSSQVKRMVANFKKAKRILRTSNSRLNVVAVNGCCYGRDSRPDKGDYYKYCGQDFWEFISGCPDLYLQIIEPLGYEAKRRTEAFEEDYAALLNRFAESFMTHFCQEGRIDWNALVSYNSGREKPRRELEASLDAAAGVG